MDEGDIAEAIEVQAAGGFLTVDDLVAFEPEFSEPVSTTYHDTSVSRPRVFGGAQYVRRDADDVCSGATEPRKDGTVAGR